MQLKAGIWLQSEDVSPHEAQLSKAAQGFYRFFGSFSHFHPAEKKTPGPEMAVWEPSAVLDLLQRWQEVVKTGQGQESTEAFMRKRWIPLPTILMAVEERGDSP